MVLNESCKTPQHMIYYKKLVNLRGDLQLLFDSRFVV